MLERLIHEVKGDPPAQLRGLTRAFHLALLSLSLPGVPLGLLYWATRPATYPWTVALTLLGVAALLSGYMLWRTRPNEQTRQDAAERLSSAMLSASAASIPFLLGCAAFHDPKTWLGCWLVAAAAYLLARRQLPALLRG